MSNTSTHTRQIVLAALCAALTAIVAPWSIVIGPISLTLGVFAVFFTGAMLPLGGAFGAMVVYLALGCIGLPVFSKFLSGPQVLVGVTGGYLMAYPVMALLVAVFCGRFRNFFLQMAGVVLALLVCYTFGTAWFMHFSGNDLATSLAWCVTPFILPDLCKGVCALLLAAAVKKRLK